MGIYLGQFSCRMLPTMLLTAVELHYANTDSFRYKQLEARCKSLLREHKELNLEKKISCWENRKLDWKWLLQTNLTSAVLNTKFENSHVFLSWHAGNLNTSMLNELEGTQLYSCHSFACPTSHIAEGWTQLPLWLFTSTYIHTLVKGRKKWRPTRHSPNQLRTQGV